MPTTRRDLLLTALASAAAPTAFARPALAEAPAAGKAKALNALFDDFMQARLKASPELATNLGLDVGPLAGLKSRLSDQSQGGVTADKTRTASELARLKALGRDGLQGLDAVNYDAVLFGVEAAASANAAFDFGETGASSPYVLSQLTGVYRSVPNFLDTKHAIKTSQDADAYIERLKAFAVQLDAQTDRARHDANLGMIPPDFILDVALVQLGALQSQAPKDSILVTSLTRRAQEVHLSPDYWAHAADIYADDIRPALGRQIERVRAMRASAKPDAGIGARPQGEAYYAAALKAYTASSMSPAEVHRVGLEQTRDYQVRIDGILKSQGMTQGTVGQRLTALGSDPKQLWAETDEAKAELIAHLNDFVAAITPRLPRFFSKPPTTPLEIRRVPKVIQAGAPLGYYERASLDGARPAIYYINLNHAADWPRWLVPSVTFHEGVPGHHLQISTAQTIEGLPLIRKTGIYSGYAEGWALYAEQLADELGMYDDNPLGRVGYLKSELWRACRMVLDSGIHTMGWSREQAIRWKMDNDGSDESAAANEVDRYCVWPGQAPSYKIGHTVINRLRDGAKARLGARFDIKAFHDAVLDSGSLPLDVLETVVARYVSTA
jgi:uncharacterized protein (DUF885 family)